MSQDFLSYCNYVHRGPDSGQVNALITAFNLPPPDVSMESSLSRPDVHALTRPRGQLFAAQQPPESCHHHHGCESALYNTPQTTSVLILTCVVVAVGVHCARAFRVFDQNIFLACVAVKELH